MYNVVLAFLYSNVIQLYTHTCGSGLDTYCVQLFATLCTVAARLLYAWDFLGKNTGLGCRFLLWVPTPGIEADSRVL